MHHRPTTFAFPEGKAFGFTIFDDTDVSTLESIRPLYDLMCELGLRTTRTVWPLRFAGESPYQGSSTLEDDDYSRYMRELHAHGFEIAFHGASMESSDRARTARALELFRDRIGVYPRSFASHARNRENLYWGAHRFGSATVRALYALLARADRAEYTGHVEGDPYFWADLGHARLDYVRGFTFDSSDLWRVTPNVLYSDARTPFVRNWFSTCDADNVEEFVALLSDRNVDALERDGGLCIVSTHLGKGFVARGRVDPRVERILRRVAGRNGWFVPVASMLDALRSSQASSPITHVARMRLEWTWLVHSIRRRLRKRSYHKAELEYLAGTRQSGSA